MVSEPAAGASVFAASADACAAVVAYTSLVLLPHPVIRDAAPSHSFYISVREAGP